MYYLIMCRSLTYAQRIFHALERAGIPARLQRSPAELSHGGCGYSVRIPARHLARAMTILRRTGLPYLRIYISSPEEGFQEVAP